MNRNRRFFYALTLLAIFFGIYFLRSYISLVGLAFLTVLVFNPIYKRFYEVFKKRSGLASTLTIFIALLCVIIPLVIVTFLAITQIIKVVNDANTAIYQNNESFSSFVNASVDRVNEYLTRLNITSVRLTSGQVKEYAYSLVQPALRFMLDFFRGLGGTTASFFTNSIIYIILLGSIFPNQEKIVRFIKRVSPLTEEIDNLYLRKLKAMALSMVKGTFVIALIQGTLGGIFLNIAGVPYTFFLVIFLTFLSIIPLGGGIISIPIGIILLLTGNVWQGLLILLTHFLIITNIDNFIRPKLVSEEAKLPEALTLLSVFAGVKMFGPLGFIYGPVVMIFLYTTLEIYNRHYAPKFTQE